MSSTPSYFRVGLFTLTGAVILTASLIAFGLRGAFEEKLKFETAIPGDVEGLAVGSTVSFRGVPVGEVKQIDFAWNVYPRTESSTIIVRFDVRNNILPFKETERVHQTVELAVVRGLRARVQAQGVTGTSILAIDSTDPKKTPPVKIDFEPRDLYVPAAPTQLSQILSSLENTLAKLERIEVQPSLDRIEKLLETAENVVAGARSIQFPKIDEKVQAILGEVLASSRKLSVTMDLVQEEVRNLDLVETRQEITVLVRDVQETNRRLQALLDHSRRIDPENINEALAGVRRAAESLDRLLAEIKAYPAGAVLGEPPAPARSIEKKKR